MIAEVTASKATLSRHLSEGFSESFLVCFAGHFRQSDEPVALKALRGFHTLKRGFSLVPEHVETRSLYNPEKPGVEQVCKVI